MAFPLALPDVQDAALEVHVGLLQGEDFTAAQASPRENFSVEPTSAPTTTESLNTTSSLPASSSSITLLTFGSREVECRRAVPIPGMLELMWPV